MTTILANKGEFLLKSIYDGEKYYSKEYSLEDAQRIENEKRSKFLEQGFDVEEYEKQYELLTEEKIRESRKAKNIRDRAKILEEYNDKIKELSQKYLDGSYS